MAKKKISNAHFVVFLSCRCQNVENVHETFINSKILFENEHSSLIIEYGMYLKCLQKPRCLGWFKTSQALLSAVHKTRLNSSKDNFIAKSFRLSTKRKLSILLNFLFPFLSFIGVFSILKCKTFVLETTTS